MTTNNGVKSVRDLDRSSQTYVQDLERGYSTLTDLLNVRLRALNDLERDLAEVVTKDLDHHFGLRARVVSKEQIPPEIRQRVEALGPGLSDVGIKFENPQRMSASSINKINRIITRRRRENGQVKLNLERDIEEINASCFDYTVALLGLFCYGSLTFDPKVTRKHSHFYMVRKGEGFVYEGHFEMPDAGELRPADLGRRLREGPYVSGMIVPDMFRDEKFLDALRKGYEAEDTNAFLVRNPAAVLPPGFDMEFAVIDILSDMLGQHIGIEGLRARINAFATDLHYARTRG